MDESTLNILLVVLVVLLFLSAFFAGSETALMALNRYRLRHLAKSGHRGALFTERLLKRPDRLIGMILLGNITVHSASAAIVTYITLRLFGESWIPAATGILTVFILVFGEIAPKTLSALHPEKVAIPSAYVYMPLQWIAFPFVYVINLMSNGLLRMFGVSPEEASQHSLSTEELRSVVAEAGALIPQRHQKMLLSLLDLEKSTVEDIMVPRNEIIGIDLTAPPDKVKEQLINSKHTRLPLYNDSIDDVRGMIHLRNSILGIVTEPFDPQNLLKLAREPYFIPEGTPLNQQLLNFQNNKRRIAFVVDEYGDIQGLVTLQDILEEVVGEFSPDQSTRAKNVTMDPDGTYLVNGAISIRTLNRNLGWRLPTAGPRTVNGLVLEQLEDIPKPGKKIMIKDYEIEITDAQANAVKTARIRPPAMIKPSAEAAA